MPGGTGPARAILPDVLEPGLLLVICGTAAGTVSAQLGHYYAGPGNKFWQTLHDTRLTSRLLAPAEFLDLPSFGIGLTDLEKEQCGADAEISFAKGGPLLLREKIVRYAPRVLCFSSKRAAKQYFGLPHVGYGVQADRIGDTTIFVAPSTSGLAIASWDPRVWGALAKLVRRVARRASGRPVARRSRTTG